MREVSNTKMRKKVFYLFGKPEFARIRKSAFPPCLIMADYWAGQGPLSAEAV